MWSLSRGSLLIKGKNKTANALIILTSVLFGIEYVLLGNHQTF